MEKICHSTANLPLATIWQHWLHLFQYSLWFFFSFDRWLLLTKLFSTGIFFSGGAWTELHVFFLLDYIKSIKVLCWMTSWFSQIFFFWFFFSLHRWFMIIIADKIILNWDFHFWGKHKLNCMFFWLWSYQLGRAMLLLKYIRWSKSLRS